MKTSPWAMLAIVLLALSTAACGKKPAPVEAAPVAAPETDTRDADREAAEAAARAAREAEEARRRAEAERRANLEEMVFFDYDRSEIRPDAETVLRAKLPLLRESPAVRLLIEGHADDRGSTEYNLALSVRRANAVRDFFLSYGLDATRFEIAGFGEERPLVVGTGEASWARNRRAQFVIRGDVVTTPETSR